MDESNQTDPTFRVTLDNAYESAQRYFQSFNNQRYGGIPWSQQEEDEEESKVDLLRQQNEQLHQQLSELRLQIAARPTEAAATKPMYSSTLASTRSLHPQPVFSSASVNPLLETTEPKQHDDSTVKLLDALEAYNAKAKLVTGLESKITQLKDLDKWAQWTYELSISISANGLHDYFSNEIACPTVVSENQQSPENAYLKSLIYHSVHPKLAATVGLMHCGTFPGMYNSLRSHFRNSKGGYGAVVEQKWNNIKYNGAQSTIDELNKISLMKKALEGKRMSDEKKIKKLQSLLPDILALSILQFKRGTSPTFQEVCSFIIEQEQVLKQCRETNNASSTRLESKTKVDRNGKPLNKYCQNCEMNNHSTSECTKKTNGSTNAKKTPSTEFFKCGLQGHWAKDCKAPMPAHLVWKPSKPKPKKSEQSVSSQSSTYDNSKTNQVNQMN